MAPNTARIPAHQTRLSATQQAVLGPRATAPAPPRFRLRTALPTMVNGWFSATGCIQPGSVSAGTDVAAVGPNQGRDNTHKRGLAGAVGPQQGGDLPGLGDQVEAVERRNLAEALRKPLRLDDGAHARYSLRSMRDVTKSYPSSRCIKQV
jgi:hypothetical protein